MDAVVSIGENVQINDYVHIAAINNVIIGRDTLIASKVFISDHNHGIFLNPISIVHQLLFLRLGPLNLHLCILESVCGLAKM
ncbi:hypothetical protein MUTS16_54080 [Escherichia coli]|nr:hypothetical protein MUTS16_54080 [Escherichia coli]